MKSLDRISSLFWLFISIFILIESVHLGVGLLQKPERGFMAFGGSILLGILSIVLFIQTFFKSEQGKMISPFPILFWKRVLVVLISLLLYAIFVESAGYLISTFLLMTFLFKILKGMNWKMVVFGSFLITFASYLIFAKGLDCQLPYGLFGF